jgi:hypothetical protein
MSILLRDLHRLGLIQPRREYKKIISVLRMSDLRTFETVRRYTLMACITVAIEREGNFLILCGTYKNIA